MKAEKDEGKDAGLFGEIQILLAEKRTALAVLRTGIAMAALPLSVLSLLVVTSKYYQPEQVLHFLVPLLALSVGLAVFAAYLVIKALLHVRRFDRMIRELKREHSTLAQFME